MFIVSACCAMVGCGDGGTSTNEVADTTKKFQEDNKKHQEFGPDPDVKTAPPAGTGGGAGK